jgi:hypothetical protein
LTIHGFEELKTLVGHEAGVSAWFAVPQDLISQFAVLTRRHPVDSRRSRTGARRIALRQHHRSRLPDGVTDEPASCAKPLTFKDDFKMGVNYGFNRLRFPAPVPSGSRIRARVTLNALKESTGHVEIAWGVTIEIENSARPALGGGVADSQIFLRDLHEEGTQIQPRPACARRPSTS